MVDVDEQRGRNDSCSMAAEDSKILVDEFMVSHKGPDGPMTPRTTTRERSKERKRKNRMD